MKAAVLKRFGSALETEQVADPVIGTGEVIVDIAAAGVLSYANEVFSGERKYMLELPVIPGPGGIGRVSAIGPDATHLAIGDWVFCDPIVRSRDSDLSPDITLQGWSARGPGGLKLQQHFRDGAFAQRMRVPTENAKPIGLIDERDAPRWCALGTLLVPYGGFLAANLQAGETVLISAPPAGLAARRSRWPSPWVRQRSSHPAATRPCWPNSAPDSDLACTRSGFRATRLRIASV